jgi:phage shock protein E
MESNKCGESSFAEKEAYCSQRGAAKKAFCSQRGSCECFHFVSSVLIFSAKNSDVVSYRYSSFVKCSHKLLTTESHPTAAYRRITTYRNKEQIMIIARRMTNALHLLTPLLLRNQASAFYLPSKKAGSALLFQTRTFLAAPGVVIDSPSDIQNALRNPQSTVVDARGIDEIQQQGYYAPVSSRWVHAPCSLSEAPLLSAASASLLPDKEAPVVVYCASGKRATFAKKVLEEQGYTHVLNAGGFPGDMEYLTRSD